MKIKINKIKSAFKKFPRQLAENDFLFSLVLIFIALILGGIIFYQYVILVQKKEPEIIKKPLPFNENALQEVLKTLKKHQEKFEETEIENSFNPFKSP